MLASTVNLPPRNLLIVRALAGDSTITSDLPEAGFVVARFAIGKVSWREGAVD